MAIHKLPEHIINKLKAGEIVERPASVLKELVENSLDAGATKIQINIKDGGKNLIQVQDNGYGIELSDMDLLLERYATSKTKIEEDLYLISQYGFRGEALASIAEVSKVSVLSKTAYSQIGTKLIKRGQELIMNHIPVPFEHGTIVMIEDLFFNVPARLKFLKSAQTEFYYCYNYFVDIALWHYSIHFVFQKNDKTIFELLPVNNITERITHIFKKDYSKNLHMFEKTHDYMDLQGVVSDPSLRFGSKENMKIYVNKRPVHDKIINRALMDTYKRQITPGEYPFAILMLKIDPKFVDVNVHPRKTEVRFSDSRAIYNFVYSTVTEVLGANKIASVDMLSSDDICKQSVGLISPVKFTQNNLNYFGSKKYNSQQDVIPFALDNGQRMDHAVSEQIFVHDVLGEYQVVGQLWNSYIVVQTNDGLHYIDQHALAERISFEKMKKTVQGGDADSKSFLSSELLLQPLRVFIQHIIDLDEKITQLNALGFDISLLGEKTVVVYAVPKIFVIHKIDLETLFNHIFYLENISFDHVLDKIFASKACKTSIKAGHKLSYQQMVNLIEDGFKYIEGMFVCQHGRPFFVKIDKSKIDKLFDR